MNVDGPADRHHTGKDLVPTRWRRFAPLAGAIIVGMTLVGFLTGIREPQTTDRPPPEPAIGDAAALPAPTYSELRNGTLRSKTKVQQSIAQLRFDRPGIFDTVIRTEEMKQEALMDRARNRAYDGAPPTIPHPAEGMFAASCLTCHGEGLKVGDRIASMISHAHLTNCTQCHVEQDRSGLPFRDQPPENRFVGVYRAGPGQRASPGAPPTIPHHTWMRENCVSCHGLVTRPGLRTTHPWLTNCTQCHAPSAAFDQVNFLRGGR